MASEVTAMIETTDMFDLTTTDYPNIEEVTTIEPNYGLSNSNVQDSISPVRQNAVFEVFNILEITMTALELMIWIAAAIKMPRWRRNYRNQMLMQISIARFVKRLIFTFKYLQEHKALTDSSVLNVALNSAQIYIDFVIVILVFFFIKHMYDSLIIVLVKVRQNSLYKISVCSWFLPAPISAMWSLIIIYKTLDEWLVYLLICCVFRWPLIFLGTSVYIAVLYKVLSDNIRKFARGLTIVTFLMCLVINFYLFSKDVIHLWCIQSFETILISYVSGLVMNFLILSLYFILISLEYKHSNNLPQLRALNSMPDNSIYEVNKI